MALNLLIESSGKLRPRVISSARNKYFIVSELKRVARETILFPFNVFHVYTVTFLRSKLISNKIIIKI